MSRVKPRRPTTSGHHALARVAHLHHLHLPAALLRQLERGGPLESPWVVAGLAGLLAAWLSGVTALTWLAARAELPYALMFASQHLTAPTRARPPLASVAPGSADRS